MQILLLNKVISNVPHPPDNTALFIIKYNTKSHARISDHGLAYKQTRNLNVLCNAVNHIQRYLIIFQPLFTMKQRIHRPDIEITLPFDQLFLSPR
jgi:hypothetical protein